MCPSVRPTLHLVVLSAFLSSGLLGRNGFDFGPGSWSVVIVFPPLSCLGSNAPKRGENGFWMESYSSFYLKSE